MLDLTHHLTLLGAPWAAGESCVLVTCHNGVPGDQSMAAALPTYAGVIHNYILTSIAVSPASAALW